MSRGGWILLAGVLLLGALAQDPPPPSPPSPRGEVLAPNALESFLKGAKEEVLVLTVTATHEPLMRPLWDLVRKGVRVRVLGTKQAVESPTSYFVPLAFLSLRYANLEVKVLGGSKVDPRVLVDRRYMLVGPPLEGVPPEVAGPLLLFTDPEALRAELQRFEAYWALAPYCAPQARYEPARGVVATCLPSPSKR